MLSIQVDIHLRLSATVFNLSHFVYLQIDLRGTWYLPEDPFMKVGDAIPPYPRHTSGSPFHCFRMPSMLMDRIQSLLFDASWDSMASYVKLRTPHAEGSRIHGESTCRPPHVNERRQRVNSSCVKTAVEKVRTAELHFKIILVRLHSESWLIAAVSSLCPSYELV